MKTKTQKSDELKRAKELLESSQSLIFADFSKISAEDVRKLRGELKKVNANFLVIKKRLLGLLLKEKGINADLKQFKISVGTIFSEGNIEQSVGPAFKFFSTLPLPEGGVKDVWIKHLLSGYDVKSGELVPATQIVYIGKLPSREVLLGQLLGMLSAPIRSFLYVLDQKAKQGGGNSSATPATDTPTPETPSGDAPISTPDPEQKVELTQAQA